MCTGVCGDHFGHGIEGRHDAERAIVVHAEITVLGTWVFPGDHEDRVAVLDEKVDERVFGRQIEDVVLHDPGGDDQNRLGTHRVRRWLVLDQFDQPIAIDDASRRHGHVAANLELLGTRRPLATDGALPILGKVLRAPHEVHAALFERALQDLGVRQRKVGGRHRVEDLPGREREHALMLLGHSAHIGRRVVPPLLREQEGLGDEAEGRRPQASASKRRS